MAEFQSCQCVHCDDVDGEPHHVEETIVDKINAMQRQSITNAIWREVENLIAQGRTIESQSDGEEWKPALAARGRLAFRGRLVVFALLSSFVRSFVRSRVCVHERVCQCVS